jgi:hypothetical protein
MCSADFTPQSSAKIVLLPVILVDFVPLTAFFLKSYALLYHGNVSPPKAYALREQRRLCSGLTREVYMQAPKFGPFLLENTQSSYASLPNKWV